MKKPVFRFLSFQYDENDAQLTLSYCFDEGEAFNEIISFRQAPKTLSLPQKEALHRIFKHLHLAAGVSYYKASAPAEINIETSPISREEADFFNKFYVNGLAEFAYQNGLDLRDQIRFPYDDEEQAQALSYPLPQRTAVPIGGGKDSCVTVEILKHFSEEMVLFSLGDSGQISRMIEEIGCPGVNVRRKISPYLLQLNREQKALNGHVPITGILSFITLACAVLYGFDTVAMSNENSANEGNLLIDGFEVNHQYSKSLAFEVDFVEHVQRSILSTFHYFSLLRPLSELAITSLFSTFEHYHDIFISCNRAYKLNKQERLHGWCADCPKCRFVFLALAPYLSPATLTRIFSKNMLDDSSQLEGFEALVGISGHKPFECVGSLSECQAAFKTIAMQSEWQASYIVKEIAPTLLQKNIPDLAQCLHLSDEHQLPEPYYQKLNEFTKSVWQKHRHLGIG